MPPSPYDDLEAKLGYSFRDSDLLRAALVHTTYLNEHPTPGLERITRLAFLGDAVVELAVRSAFMLEMKNQPRGVLSVASDKVVTNEALADLARRIDLGRWLALGKGEKQSGGQDKTRVLAEAFEAVAGAIYLDSEEPAEALRVVGALVRPVADGPHEG